MKKFATLLIAVLLMMTMVTGALAGGSASYKNGKLSWSVSEEGYFELTCNGHKIDTGWDYASGSTSSISVSKGDRIHVVSDAGADYYITIDVEEAPATEAPTAEPTEEPTAEPTAEPTTEPSDDPTTQAPATTAPATQAPTATPATTTDTSSSSSSDSDVPKTGDTTATMMMVILATMLAAAGYLFCTRKEK